MALSVEQNNIKPKDESPLPARTQTEERKMETSNTQITEISTTKNFERTSEFKEKTTTKIVGVKVVEREINEKEKKPLANTTSEKYREPAPSGRQVAGPLQGAVTTNIQTISKTGTREHVSQEKTTSKLSEKIEIPSVPPPRSPSSGRRQLPPDPRAQQAAKENSTIKSTHTQQELIATKEQRTPAAKPLSELSSNTNSTPPKSTKAHAAPPVPRSSGSVGGRSQVPSSDTSGYPDAFSNKRKSRDSRELTDTALSQLGRFIIVTDEYMYTG